MTRRYIRLGGVSAPGNSIPAIVRTPLDIAFAGIPGLQILIDPDYLEGGLPRNLAAPREVLQHAGGGGAIATAAFPNDQKAFSVTDTAAARLTSELALSPASWSVVAVAAITARPSANVHNVLGPEAALAGVTPRVGYKGDGVSAHGWSSGQSGSVDPILSYQPLTSYVGRTVVSLWTYSGGRLRYFENGEQRAEAASADLTVSYQARQYSLLRYSRGLFGNVGVFSTDLSQQAFASHRARMFAYLIAKYGVA